MGWRLGEAHVCSQLFLFGRTPSSCFEVVAYHSPVIHPHFSVKPMYRPSAKLRQSQKAPVGYPVKPAGGSEELKLTYLLLKSNLVFPGLLEG